MQSPICVWPYLRRKTSMPSKSSRRKSSCSLERRFESMTSQVVASSSAKTLADFQTIVQQKEGIFGPLIALSSQQGNNWIVLEENPVKPANLATLQIIQQEPAPAVSGSTV